MARIGHDIDDAHGKTIVASLTVQLQRDGCMALSGSITDKEYARFLLETALDLLMNNQHRQAIGQGSKIIVPAYDTALVGTDAEKKLLAARDELSNAMAR
jgi:hypothetical protein